MGTKLREKNSSGISYLSTILCTNSRCSTLPLLLSSSSLIIFTNISRFYFIIFFIYIHVLNLLMGILVTCVFSLFVRKRNQYPPLTFTQVYLQLICLLSFDLFRHFSYHMHIQSFEQTFSFSRGSSICCFHPLTLLF